VRSLLRFQGVVLARVFEQPAAILPLAGLAVLVTLGAYGIGDSASATLAFMLGVAVAVLGMTRTFESLDVVRWIVPIRRDLAVRAHFGFWLTVLSPLFLIVAIGRSHDALGAVILFFHLALVVVAAAAIVMFYQRITRRGFGVGAIAAGIVVGSALVWPTAWSFYRAWTGHAESLVLAAIVAGVSWALGVPSFLREELEPSATGGIVGSRSAYAAEGRPVSAWPPAWSVLRATYGPVMTSVWIVLGAFPLLFPSFNIAAVWTPIAGSNLAGLGLQSWRWLAATPIDRDRAFRILFGPLLMFVLAVSGVRFAINEATHDRSAFFRDERREGFEYVGFSTLTLSQILECGPNGNGYRPAEFPRVAVGVRDHLRRQFGMSVAVERIEADLRPGWPKQPKPGGLDDDMGYVLDGLERVRLDVGDEIARASRTRDVSITAGLVLAFLVLLRVQFQGKALGVFLVILVGLPLVTLASFRRDVPALAAALDKPYEAIAGMSLVVLCLALAAAGALGALLWRSARRAFRRIDLLDLPNPPAWLRS
jgi:hypothetical protein